MSMTLVQDELHGIMPSLISQSQPTQHNSYHRREEYNLNQVLELSYSSVRQSPLATHHYNDQDQYPLYEEFDAIVQDYLRNLSSKKRDKALIDQARYAMILQVLKDPKNTAVSTAQFRFWVKKMFQLTPRQVVCHDGKPVVMREKIYGILVRAHREAHHGGRDKTSALVRRRYSWIPKELIARFVRHCPFCISRRIGSQRSPLSLGIFLPASPPTYPMLPSHTQQLDDDDNRARAPSMTTTSSSASSSSASYPDEMMLMAAAAAHHQQQQHQDSMSNSAVDLSAWQSNHSYYAANHNSYYNNPCNSNSTKQQSYPMASSSISDEQQHQQPVMMHPPLSVNYAQEYGLKQNPNYPLLDDNNINTYAAHTNTTTTNRNSSMYYNTPITTVSSSPLLSPSSLSTSVTSSPVHPIYNENNANNDYIHQRQQQQQQGLNLLSHHQLFLCSIEQPPI